MSGMTQQFTTMDQDTTERTQYKLEGDATKIICNSNCKKIDLEEEVLKDANQKQYMKVEKENLEDTNSSEQHDFLYL